VFAPSFSNNHPPFSFILVLSTEYTGRPEREEESHIFPIPIAVTPEAQAILERLDRSVRGTQESPEPFAAPAETPSDQVT